ncbi:MAG: helix-hairpin-helix domain-containing protein [Burkholderiales bacterium]|nr:MAG: helix-hairpin-helix domain-containing protein [Burkholderiales bacterium]
MKCRWIQVPFSLALLLFASAALAAEEPKPAAKPASAAQSKSAPANAGSEKKKPKPVEINSATAAQLKTIPGIGDAEAQRIIINRPYMTRSHLVTKNVLSYEAYLAVKDRIIAIPPEPPKAKK